MNREDIPNIPCDYHGNDWHQPLFAGNTAGVGFIIELLSYSFYTLRTHVYKGLAIIHPKDSTTEKRLFVDVLFPLNAKTLQRLPSTFHFHSPEVGFVSQLMPLLATVISIQTHLASLVNCYPTLQIFALCHFKWLNCWIVDFMLIIL